MWRTESGEDGEAGEKSMGVREKHMMWAGVHTPARPDPSPCPKRPGPATAGRSLQQKATKTSTLHTPRFGASDPAWKSALMRMHDK